MPIIALKLSTMGGEIFKHQYSEMAEILHKLSTMFGGIFRYQHSQIAIIALKLYTMVDENLRNDNLDVQKSATNTQIR